MIDERDPLTREVIGAAIEVHRHMGPGLLESVYQKCMEHELKDRGVYCDPRARLALYYKEKDLGEDFIMDLYFPHRLVVELKVVEEIIGIHKAQLLTYLKLSNTHVGLLINFHVPLLKDGILRMVL